MVEVVVVVEGVVTVEVDVVVKVDFRVGHHKRKRKEFKNKSSLVKQFQF